MFRHIIGCCLLVLACAAPASAGEQFAFALWGDMPYAKAGDGPKIQALIEDVNASDIAFSIYDGDIKDGSSRCTDDVYTAAIAMFDGFAKPAIYIPGDNEWTDCHRLNNGGYDNLERLDHIRRTMMTSAESFGRTRLGLTRQGAPGTKFSENVRFSHGGIIFVGLNIPGSNNNRVHDEKECTSKSARKWPQCEADNAEYRERDAANIAWMDTAFALAAQDKAAGVVLVFQADPGFDLPETEDVNERKDPDYDGYTAFLEAVTAHARSYAGQILLVHGDTHFFKLDKPLIDQEHLIPNITRLQTFGSPNIHWVRVSVDTTSRNVFTVAPMIVPR
jgi:hypothetical protein